MLPYTLYILEYILKSKTLYCSLHRSDEASPMILPRNKKELHEAVYRTLPTSLVQPCVVRSKVFNQKHLIIRSRVY